MGFYGFYGFSKNRNKESNIEVLELDNFQNMALHCVGLVITLEIAGKLGNEISGITTANKQKES